MYFKIKANIIRSKLKSKHRAKLWVFIDKLMPELHSIMKLALEKNHDEYPPITQESNGCWGFDKGHCSILANTR